MVEKKSKKTNVQARATHYERQAQLRRTKSCKNHHHIVVVVVVVPPLGGVGRSSSAKLFGYVHQQHTANVVVVAKHTHTHTKRGRETKCKCACAGSATETVNCVRKL